MRNRPFLPTSFWAILSGVLITLVMFLLLPDVSGREMDTDEGLHLMMSWLYHQDFSFFSQIKYDHFPLFDVLLSCWLAIFSFDLSAARAGIILLSSLLLWLFFLLIQQRAGWIAALVAVVLTLSSEGFLRDSTSILQALPWIGFGLGSLAVLRFGDGVSMRSKRLYVSAALIAIAIQIKLFALLMVPALIIELMFVRARENKKTTLILVFVWLTVASVISFLLLAITAPALFNVDIFPETVRYLVDSHLGQESLMPNLTLWTLLQDHKESFPLVVLAVLGLLLSSSWRQVRDWFPLIWLGCDVIALSVLHPIWQHYYTMISLPLIWLASLALGDIFLQKSVKQCGWENGVQAWMRQGVGIMFWMVLLLLPSRIENSSKSLQSSGYSFDRQLVTTLKALAFGTHWMVTDRPIYPFLCRINVPPELAVTSLTLMQSGVQSEEDYLMVVDRYHPELVLLARFSDLRQSLRVPLQQRGYTRIYESDGKILYAKRSKDV